MQQQKEKQVESGMAYMHKDLKQLLTTLYENDEDLESMAAAQKKLVSIVQGLTVIDTDLNPQGITPQQKKSLSEVMSP